jgi:hypothetical protein
VVDEHRLTAEAEVRMAVGAAVAPAAPGRGPLLRRADHDDAGAPLALGALEVGTRHLLLGLALAKAHHRDASIGGEALDRLHVTAPDLAEQRRRRDLVALIEQEAHDHPLGHQPRHVTLQEQAVDRAHLQGDVVCE